ncbi:MAG: protein kinase [Myxococcales bacterium]|nr:protein kinase [Myxococcales bacterium]
MSTPRGLAHAAALPEQHFAGNGRFELRRILGEGSMGIVYEAFDHERGMLVALKTVRQLDAQTLYRLKTEFRARVDLEHRNLVRLGELLHDEGHWFFTMELVEGWPFLEWVRTGAGETDDPSTPELRLRDAIRQLASGLDVLHRAGNVHRDLKPSNVLITRKGRVVVLDFGLVGESAPSRRSAGLDVIGTAAYMAPEQARSSAVGPAADVYSVGVMMYEALSGRLPFDGAPLEIITRKQNEDPLPPLVGVPPTELSSLCMEMLRRRTQDRPSTAAIVARLTARAQPEERPPPFVGRATELGILDAALDEVAAGSTHTVFVEGESGIGKSSLVRSFVDRVHAQHPSALVLSGRCYERESVPFKGIDNIVDALAHELMRRHPVDVALHLTNDVEALARVFPVLRRVSAIARLSVPRPVSPVELRARAFRGLRALLTSLAAAQTIVIVLDDLQWADTDSIALLREILHPPNAPRILVVITRREVGLRPELPGPVRAIPLGRLSAEEGRELISLLAPGREPEADALVSEAGGHPMFMHELVRHHGAPLTSTSRFDDALWARILRMDHRARRVLELIAVAGAPLPQGVIGQALDYEPPRLTKLLGLLRATWLVRTGGTRSNDPVEPYHDRVREAVVARVPAPRRRRYHERLATVLLASPIADKDPLTIVRHLEAAGHVEHAGELAIQAARRAEEALAFELAAALWEVALRLGTTDQDARRDLLLRRAQALSYAGRGPESAAVFLAAAEGATAETGFQCRRHAAHELLVSGHIHDGLALLRSVLAEIGEHLPATTGAAKRQLVWRWLRIAVRGTQFRTRTAPDARTSVDELRLDMMRSASLGLSMVDVLPGAAFQARAVLVALRIGDPRRIAYALCFHAMYLASSGTRVPQARKLVAQARAIAHELEHPLLLGWTRAGEGITEFFAGRHARAFEILEEAETHLSDRSAGTSAELNHIRNFILFALRRMGAYDQLRDRQTEYVRDAMRRGDRYAATSFVWSSNVVWLAADDVARARSDLASVVWSRPEDGLHLQHWFAVRAQAELAMYEDDRAQIDALVPALRAFVGPAFAHVQAVATETRYQLARVAIRNGDAALARREIAPLDKIRVPYVRAFVRLVHAGADATEGKIDAAREWLAGAIADAESCQMTTLASLARRRFAELGSDGQAVAAADIALAARGIVDPLRFARMFATWPSC